jgi:hypothetical protein
MSIEISARCDKCNTSLDHYDDCYCKSCFEKSGNDYAAKKGESFCPMNSCIHNKTDGNCGKSRLENQAFEFNDGFPVMICKSYLTRARPLTTWVEKKASAEP